MAGYNRREDLFMGLGRSGFSRQGPMRGSNAKTIIGVQSKEKVFRLKPSIDRLGRSISLLPDTRVFPPVMTHSCQLALHRTPRNGAGRGT